jgi:hypothetical protein
MKGRIVGDSAALRPPVEEPRSVDPDPLPEGRLDRRLRCGADRAARQRRWRAVGLDCRTERENSEMRERFAASQRKNSV